MNLFAFIGDDALRRDEALALALAAFLGPLKDDPLARETFHGDDLALERVLEAYEGVSIFSDRKALLLRQFDKIPAAAQKELLKSFSHENPNVGIFLAAEKLEAGNAARKLFEARGRVETFKLPYANQVPAWLMTRAREKFKRALKPPAAALLQELVGDDLGDLERELEKLDTFLPPGAAIDLAEVEEFTSPQRAIGIFEFQKVMGLRERDRILPALRSLLEAGETPIGINIRLYSHFLALLKIRTLQEEGRSEADIASELGLNVFFHFKRLGFSEQARSRAPAQWKRLLSRLARLDGELKQGLFTRRFELEMLFFSLA